MKTLGRMIGAAVLLLGACTAAQQEKVQSTVPLVVAGQSVAIRALGGPIDLEAQQRLVVRGNSTAERQELVRGFRAVRKQRLDVVRVTVDSIAKAAAGLGTDLAVVDADLQHNDAQIDAQIVGMAVEGQPVPSSPAPAVPAAPAPPTPPVAPAPPAR